MVVYLLTNSTNFTTMDEHLTQQEQLTILIAQGNLMIANGNKMVEDGNTILIKLRKTLNGFLYVGIPTIALFLGSYWYNNNRMTTMENTRMTDDQLEEKYATKAGVVFLQNDVFDLSNSTYVSKEGVSQREVEKQYNKALKQFTGDVTRGVTR